MLKTTTACPDHQNLRARLGCGLGRVIAACVVTGCLSACASPSAAVTEPASLTVDQAKAALTRSRSLWKDPDSIRDTRIGQPYSSGCWGHMAHMATPPDACICIATNARNSFGGYTGLRTQVALIKANSVIDLIDARLHDQCASMVPWPEFDGRQR